MHDAARRWIEGIAAMHRAAIVPQHEIADLPPVVPGQARLGRERPQLVEQRFGLRERQVHEMRIPPAAQKERLPACLRVRAYQRMDGARPASIYTALTKATTAATLRQPTGPIPPGSTNPDPLLNLGLENAATAGGGKITTLHGGVPIMVDGQVIGGVGVGGGTGEQDAQVARAGIQAFTNQLDAPRAGPGQPGPTDKDRPKAGQAEGTASKREDGSF